MSLDELEEYFKTAVYPPVVKLNEAVTIKDVPLFIETNLRIARLAGHLPAFSAYQDRLLQLKEIIENPPKPEEDPREAE